MDAEMNECMGAQKRLQQAIKRGLDIVVAGTALVVLSPLMGVIAFLGVASWVHQYYFDKHAPESEVSRLLCISFVQ